MKWKIEEIDLHEVSVCTFPAYEDTGIQARHKELEQHREKRMQQWKHEQLKKIGR